MKRYRIVQVGLGDFGRNWFTQVLPSSERVEVVGVVTSNTAKGAMAIAQAGFSGCRVFSQLADALTSLKPDILLNITPPHIHKAVTLEALKRGITVICEKPIADSMEDALEMLRASEKYRVPVIIAENYRYDALLRRAGELFQQGCIGELNTVYFDFFRAHQADNYHNRLQHPLLLDIAVHHFDSIFFVTGLSAKRVLASTWDAPWSIYSGNSSAYADLVLENNVHALYRASLSCFGNETAWTGNWRIEGKDGVMKLTGDEIRLTTKEGESRYDIVDTQDSIKAMLCAILDALDAGEIAENDIRYNIKSYAAVMAAIASAETQQWVDL